jgi:hypothetical protein
VGAGLSVFAGRLFWPIAILVLTLATPAFAGGIHVDLDCVPLPIANQPADRDPVAQINVRLDAEDGHFTLYVMHETVSGQKFSRMDQYRDIGLRHVGPVRDWSDVWQWYGGLIRNPDVGMVGYITEANGQYAYMEWVLNLTTKAEEKVVHANCSVAG